MNDILEGFMAYLEKNELVEFDMRDESESSSSSKNRLQWHVFIAKHFGLDMHYEYDICFYGPQSRAPCQAIISNTQRVIQETRMAG